MSRYSGKYAAKGYGRPLASWILILLVVLSLSTGAVVAYLSDSTGVVKNTFEAESSTDPTIREDFDGKTKESVAVYVGDPGYSVYVRAAILVTWKNQENGDVLATVPVAGTDYDITIGTGWKKIGDYYYCLTPVASDDETPLLIESCTPKGTPPEGYEQYDLNVEIISQTIQAKGTTDVGDIPAIEAAWKIELDDLTTS